MQKEMIILDEDKAYARARVAELQKEIQDLGPEFYEVFNQSSETWHDNAPFDALRDRQSVLDAELQQLRTILRNSVPGVPHHKKGIVGVGSMVTLDTNKTYRIAGDWTPHAGQLKAGITTLSCNAPLARSLLGRRESDHVMVNGNRVIIQRVA